MPFSIAQKNANVLALLVGHDDVGLAITVQVGDGDGAGPLADWNHNLSERWRDRKVRPNQGARTYQRQNTSRNLHGHFISIFARVVSAPGANRVAFAGSCSGRPSSLGPRRGSDQKEAGWGLPGTGVNDKEQLLRCHGSRRRSRTGTERGFRSDRDRQIRKNRPHPHSEMKTASGARPSGQLVTT